MIRRIAGAVAALCLVATGSAHAQGQAAIPIPGPLDGPLPIFQGAPVKPHPLSGFLAPQNDALAPNGGNGSGLAAGNGGASPFPGPLGNGTTSASALQFGTCASLAFAQDGRLLGVCNGPLGGSLRLLDPTSLATLGSLSLPSRPNPADRLDIAGGAHFIVRRDGSLLVPTNQRELLTIEVRADGFEQTGAVDLSGVLRSGERPFAVAAGFDGYDWVAGNQGTIATVPRGPGEPQALELNEPLAEDMATDPSGTYAITKAALYRLEADETGRPAVLWRERIPDGIRDNSSGRIHPGSGTPPVIVGKRWVAVADGTNPVRVTVFRISGPASKRLACAVPVFKAGRSAIEAHLVVSGNSIVAANSYGYISLLTTEGGKTTVGGLARVVVSPRGCRTAWTSDAISPSSQAVVSRETGMLYTMLKPPGFPDAWNLAAVDWRSGQVRFQALAGEGLGFNSEGGPVVLGPDGAAYAGSFGGVTRFADAPG